MKRLLIFFKLIFALSLPIFLLLSTVDYVSSDMGYYTSAFRENRTPEITGFDEGELLYISEEVVKYMDGYRDSFDIRLEDGEEIFGEREILHMEDVRELFLKGTIIRNIALLSSLFSLVAIAYIDKRALGSVLIMSFAFTILVMAVLGFFIMTDFDGAFTTFHLLLFDNDLWLLNPRTDVLIQMLPLNFFSGMAYRIAALFFIEILAVLIVGIALKRIRRV